MRRQNKHPKLSKTNQGEVIWYLTRSYLINIFDQNRYIILVGGNGGNQHEENEESWRKRKFYMGHYWNLCNKYIKNSQCLSLIFLETTFYLGILLENHPKVDVHKNTTIYSFVCETSEKLKPLPLLTHSHNYKLGASILYHS